MTPIQTDIHTPKDGKVDSLCGSPIVFSDTLKSKYGRNLCHKSEKPTEDSHSNRTESQQGNTKGSKDESEWVEQYEPGVYITFTELPSGQKGLKRVRFR